MTLSFLKAPLNLLRAIVIGPPRFQRPSPFIPQPQLISCAPGYYFTLMDGIELRDKMFPVSLIVRRQITSILLGVLGLLGVYH